MKQLLASTSCNSLSLYLEQTDIILIKTDLFVNRVFGIILHYFAIFFFSSQQLEEIRKLLEEISQAEIEPFHSVHFSQLHVDGLFLPMLLEAKAKETIPAETETVAEIIEAPTIPSAQPFQRNL